MKAKTKVLTEKPTLTTQVSQYCLDAFPVCKFIESVPKKVDIYSMRWRGSYIGIRKKLVLPEYLKKMGVFSATSTPETVDVTGHFRAGQTKENMIKNIMRIAKSYNISDSRFRVLGVTLMDDKKTSSLSFRRMYKAIKLPSDKRKRKLVLGMTSGDGSNYHDLLAALSAKKITCTLAKTEKTIVMCSEEVVEK